MMLLNNAYQKPKFLGVFSWKWEQKSEKEIKTGNGKEKSANDHSS